MLGVWSCEVAERSEAAGGAATGSLYVEHRCGENAFYATVGSSKTRKTERFSPNQNILLWTSRYELSFWLRSVYISAKTTCGRYRGKELRHASPGNPSH